MKLLNNTLNFTHRLWYRAAHIVVICCLLWLFVPAEAQVYSTAQYNAPHRAPYGAPYGAMPFGSIDAQYEVQTEFNYQPYRSTIYEPFSNAKPTGPQRGGAIGEEEDDDDNSGDDWTGDFGHPSDPNQSNNGPVGEAWVLLLFAAVAAIVVYCKQGKKEMLSQKL